MTTPYSDNSAKLPNSILAWQLISEYLRQKGYCLESLRDLPLDQKKELMTSANLHASMKLAEIEAFSRLRSKIHLRK